MSHVRSFASILRFNFTRSAACPVRAIRDRVEPAVGPNNVRSAAESGSKFKEAMLTAARLVEPALDEFYATLSSEQKARFNTLQQVASR
ncbi:Spy/CpxP family protein refolding chaperone [Bradyrhizobium forestalis]|uniref:Spy/CpxP family protein refolding chaperone n=1 Tax=Bradyrhizobium forestalis TaxID=1419263 RepID=UPI0011AF87E9|nr:Spy/CpxP family protein refolding chaperone [Bradyrhizobium forestalis]